MKMQSLTSWPSISETDKEVYALKNSVEFEGVVKDRISDTLAIVENKGTYILVEHADVQPGTFLCVRGHLSSEILPNHTVLVKIISEEIKSA